MQTFLPYESFALSAACLDRQRLGKQRVEVLQLVRALTGDGSSGWLKHPACRMWGGHVAALCRYGIAVCEEWDRRGYVDNIKVQLVAIEEGCEPPYGDPRWLGRADFHASHRSNLLRKDPVWYGRYGWTESPDLPYVWPA